MPERVGALRRTLLRAFSRRFESGAQRPFLQWVTLTIVEDEGIRTQAALAERLIADPPTVSRLVARLERDGLVTRTQGKDRRTVTLSLTEAGRRELEVFRRAAEDVDRELRAALGDADYATLMRLMEKAERALDGRR